MSTKRVRLHGGTAEKSKQTEIPGNVKHSEREIYGTLWDFVMIKKGKMECSVFITYYS